MPRDRNGSFEPAIVPKRARRLGNIDKAILSLYSPGMTTRDIESHLREVYGVNVSRELISNVTEVVTDEIALRQSQPLDEMYPILYVDGLRLRIKDKGVATSKVAYLAIDVDMEGRKHALGLWIADTEAAKFCTKVIAGLHNRFISYGDQKVAAAMREIYTVPTLEAAEITLTHFDKDFGAQYPAAIQVWRHAWNDFTPLLDYPPELRRIVYTKNLIENINFQLRKSPRNAAISTATPPRQNYFTSDSATSPATEADHQEPEPEDGNKNSTPSPHSSPTDHHSTRIREQISHSLHGKHASAHISPGAGLAAGSEVVPNIDRVRGHRKPLQPRTASPFDPLPIQIVNRQDGLPIDLSTPSRSCRRPSLKSSSRSIRKPWFRKPRSPRSPQVALSGTGASEHRTPPPAAETSPKRFAATPCTKLCNKTHWRSAAMESRPWSTRIRCAHSTYTTRFGNAAWLGLLSPSRASHGCPLYTVHSVVATDSSLPRQPCDCSIGRASPNAASAIKRISTSLLRTW
ncbi:Transposase, Mutator family [Amycolatopsis lurida]|nr:Transposase, Mutator family [Amycolatopsis lurida]